MSFDTYTTLKTEIAQWLGRRSDLTNEIETMIDLFESWANRNLRVRQMEDEVTADATEYMALPADFLQMRDIQWQGSPRRQLEYVTPQYADYYDTSGAAGTPRYYSIVGNQIRLVPAPDSTTPVRMDYWQSIPALSGSQASNWLLAAYPDAYLFGALMYGRQFLVEPEATAMVTVNFKSAVDEIQRAGQRSNVGGSLQIRVM